MNYSFGLKNPDQVLKYRKAGLFEYGGTGYINSIKNSFWTE